MESNRRGLNSMFGDTFLQEMDQNRQQKEKEEEDVKQETTKQSNVLSKLEYVPFNNGQWLNRIKITNNAWPCFFDNGVGAIKFLKKFKHNYTILEPENILGIVENEEQMVEMVFNALMSKQTLIINCDAFKCEPNQLFNEKWFGNIMDAKTFLDPQNITRLGDKYPKICNKVILEKYKYSDNDFSIDRLTNFGMILAFVTLSKEIPEWALKLNNLNIF